MYFCEKKSPNVMLIAWRLWPHSGHAQIILIKLCVPMSHTQLELSYPPRPPPHPPTPPTKSRRHQGCVRRSRPGAAREQHPHSGVPSGPNSVPNPQPPHKDSHDISKIYSELCSTQPPPRPEGHRPEDRHRAADIVKGEPATFRVTSQPHHTVRTP